MVDMKLMDVFWIMLGMAVASGLLTILSGAVTGYLVFRAKRESHERLFPPKPRKSKGPIVMDEFASEVEHDDDKSGLPPIIAEMNARMGAELAMAGLKKEDR
jgi:hypothetical protein